MRERKKDPCRNISKEEALRWVNKYPETRVWIDKFRSEGTRRIYSKGMLRFHELTEKMPSDLLELAKEGTRKGEKIAERFLNNALTSAPCSDYMKKRMSLAVRSFYKEHFYDLAKRVGVIEIPQKKEYRCPTQEDLRNFKVGMNLRDVTLIDFLASVPVREETLTSLNGVMYGNN